MFDESALKFLRDNVSGFSFVESNDPEIPANVVAVSNGVSLASLENFQATPTRTRATPRLLSSASFCDYVNRYRNEGTTVYIDTDKGLFAAIIDHHDAKPAWRDRSIRSSEIDFFWLLPTATPVRGMRHTTCATGCARRRSSTSSRAPM